MANAGVWGAIGGLGEGMIKSAERDFAAENAAIDEARTKRLETLRSNLMGGRQKAQFKRTNTAAVKAAEALAAAKKTAAKEKAASDLRIEEERTRKAIQIQGMKNAAAAQNAKRTAANKGGSPFDDKNLRYDVRIEKNEQGGFTAFRKDKETGTVRGYDLEGNKYWMTGADPEGYIKFKNKSAEEEAARRLMANPDQAAIFEGRYGWLPKRFITAAAQGKLNKKAARSPSKKEEPAKGPSAQKPDKATGAKQNPLQSDPERLKDRRLNLLIQSEERRLKRNLTFEEKMKLIRDRSEADKERN